MLSPAVTYARPLSPLPLPAPEPSSSNCLLLRPPAVSRGLLLRSIQATARPSRGAFTCSSSTTAGEYSSWLPTLLRRDPKEWTEEERRAVLSGGDQVTSVLQEMILLLQDLEMEEKFEAAAVELVAQGVIGKRVDEMEAGFLVALDYMILLAEKDHDDKRKVLLDVIKQTVLGHLTKKCSPHVQVVGLLCRTPKKESRNELLRRVAAGGGVFTGEGGMELHLPHANLNDIANQADDLLETMESRPTVPDRKLLARLVLIREEARNMMGGGLLDERNDRGLSTLPAAEVNFLGKLVALKPGKAVREMIKNVMLGKDEGTDKLDDREDDAEAEIDEEIMERRKPSPVRPGMFLETVSKVLGGIYNGNVPGITAQHLEWVHRNTLEILQEIAF